MASLTDYEKGLTDQQRGLLERGLPAQPLVDSSLLRPGWHKQRTPVDDQPVLAMMPDGSGYVGPAWVAEVESYVMGQRMAWERELRTGANIAGGLGGTAGYAAGGHKGSDVGALIDAAMSFVYTSHPLNTEKVVNAPVEPANIVHGAPTYQAAPPPVKISTPPANPITRDGLPFSAKRATTRPLKTTEAKPTRSRKTPQAPPGTLPVLSPEALTSREIEREGKAAEQVVNRDIRGTNSIRSASPAAKRAERGLASVKASPTRPRVKETATRLRSKSGGPASKAAERTPPPKAAATGKKKVEPSVVLDPKTGVPKQTSGTVKVGPAYATFEEAFANKAHADAHIAEVILRDPKKKVIADWWEVSESLSKQGVHGVGRAGDTEQKALVRVRLQPGQTLEIRGAWTPCTVKGGCDVAMQDNALESGAAIIYRTTGGQVHDYPKSHF